MQGTEAEVRLLDTGGEKKPNRKEDKQEDNTVIQRIR